MGKFLERKKMSQLGKIFTGVLILTVLLLIFGYNDHNRMVALQESNKDMLKISDIIGKFWGYKTGEFVEDTGMRIRYVLILREDRTFTTAISAPLTGITSNNGTWKEVGYNQILLDYTGSKNKYKVEKIKILSKSIYNETQNFGLSLIGRMEDQDIQKKLDDFNS